MFRPSLVIECILEVFKLQPPDLVIVSLLVSRRGLVAQR
jgi:hypothetical protein